MTANTLVEKVMTHMVRQKSAIVLFINFVCFSEATVFCTNTKPGSALLSATRTYVERVRVRKNYGFSVEIGLFFRILRKLSLIRTLTL